MEELTDTQILTIKNISATLRAIPDKTLYIAYVTLNDDGTVYVCPSAIGSRDMQIKDGEVIVLNHNLTMYEDEIIRRWASCGQEANSACHVGCDCDCLISLGLQTEFKSNTGTHCRDPEE